MTNKNMDQFDSLAALAKEGKYLTFALRNEEYGLEILKVREIIGLMEITAIPNVPAYVRGVINLRGKVIPVIDLRLKFNLKEVDYTNETCVIVLNVNDLIMGIIVDRVCEVLDIAQQSIEPSPNFGANMRNDFIIGMGKIGDKVKILLNIERILTEDASAMREVPATE
ncbi:MAG: chemotaxis protein CheW [Candidatus Omnitrophica bacterium]|nr:chemotaxis protein CheW [Candidatus Omnitrophota bacterium]